MDLALSLLVLAAAAMVLGAWLAWRQGDAKRAVLMLVLAAVMAANVAIWAIPGPGSVQSAAPPSSNLSR